MLLKPMVMNLLSIRLQNKKNGVASQGLKNKQQIPIEKRDYPLKWLLEGSIGVNTFYLS
ncbi:hypothetical protein XCR1_1570008 [Xenorhabdus cabanillasii JM26]|uniref:Uncharacterized protein n=1 Tax=Xenorhabdus cabanillasii JM26 TaxID=1427517 RepID=W1IUD0_9GAMM|nr:hypothetical protein XCR1_1570008 [Xenorhabdus cabanillasii JM26]